MSKAAHDGPLTPLAQAEAAMGEAAQKGRARRAEAGSETKVGTSAERTRGAEHRADLNIGSMGALKRRGRRGARR